MTVGEIRKKVIVKTREKLDKNTTIQNIIKEVHHEVKSELMEYYSTMEGRQEINDSPHFKLSTEKAVDLLMQDVDLWIYKELDINAETTE